MVTNMIYRSSFSRSGRALVLVFLATLPLARRWEGPTQSPREEDTPRTPNEEVRFTPRPRLYNTYGEPGLVRLTFARDSFLFEADDFPLRWRLRLPEQLLADPDRSLLDPEAQFWRGCESGDTGELACDGSLDGLRFSATLTPGVGYVARELTMTNAGTSTLPELVANVCLAHDEGGLVTAPIRGSPIILLRNPTPRNPRSRAPSCFATMSWLRSRRCRRG